MKKIVYLLAVIFIGTSFFYNCANTAKTTEKTESAETNEKSENDNNAETPLCEIANVKEDFSPGIIFSDLSFCAALKEAKKKNKLIFVDAYTVWCGPCKMLSKNTFPNASVGTYFNDKFINLKIEIEKHPYGRTFQSKYGVSAYPTMLWIDGDGLVVKKIVGYHTPEQLLQAVPKN
jgi:thiol:disulfide interchange protein